MLRELAAIGLSRYAGQKAAGELIGSIMHQANLKGRPYRKDQQFCVELIYSMGPFQLVLRGKRRGETEVVIDTAVPALKEKRAYLLHAPEIFVGEQGLLYLEGSDHDTYETMTLCLTEVARCYQDPGCVKAEVVTASCYGLSTEGKILLGIERSKEDLRQNREESERRREMLKEALESREDNARSLHEAMRQEEFASEEEVMERLKEEDVFTIYDGFYYPSEKDDNCFTVLGDIRHIEKLLNPLSEEWVYYLDLDVMGQLQRVLIHPNDLVGEPKEGRRFQGKVRFYGRLDPARLILEDQGSFY